MFTLFSAHDCFLKWQSVGNSLMLEGISFQVLRDKYGNPFLAYSRLYLGICIFLQNRVLYLK